jgi:C-terminal processing protease CtpA/Prc
MIRSKKIKFFKRVAAAFSVSAVLFSIGCNQASNQQQGNYLAGNLRPLSQNERAEDFDQLLNLFKTYYGPYEFKERRFNINIEAEMARLKQLAVNASSDEEFAGYVFQFGSLLQDGHVGFKLKNSSSGIQNYRIPIFLEVVEGRVIVAEVDKKLEEELNISAGDEILSVDGKEPLSFMPIINKYMKQATEKSNMLNIMRIFLRPSFITELTPTGPMANVKFKKADDQPVKSVDIAWDKVKFNPALDKMVKPKSLSGIIEARYHEADEINSLIANVNLMGNENPFFLTKKSQDKYKFIKVYPSYESLKKAGLKLEKESSAKPPIYAALYRYKDKNILLVRSATYSPDDFLPSEYLKAYTAIFKEYQEMADVMVLDQTHNPGGSVDYCVGLYELFAQSGDRGVVQQSNTDRKWINNLSLDWPALALQLDLPWDAKNYQAMASLLEQDYDAGLSISRALPFFSGQSTINVDEQVWKKPAVVLIDELAGSCGDMFPMLIKANKRAKLFGQQTMGLGGNVESFQSLNNSQMTVRLTRGLFSAYSEDGQYPDSDMVENNGVLPDKEYSHTVKDYRGGFVEYVKAFSDYALEQIPAAAQPAPVDPSAPTEPAQPPTTQQPTPAVPTEPAPAPSEPAPKQQESISSVHSHSNNWQVD